MTTARINSQVFLDKSLLKKPTNSRVLCPYIITRKIQSYHLRGKIWRDTYRILPYEYL